MGEEIIFYVLLFVLGLFFGSFASVIIHRLKLKEGGIIMGRSKCPNCQTTLKAINLVPIFSYLSTLGKCNYCKKEISIIYPILELTTGILFFLVGYKLINFELMISLSGFEIFKLSYFLFLALITVIFVFYDILFLEINEGVLFTGILVSAIIIIIQTINPNFHIFSTFNSSYTGITGINLYLVISLFVLIIISLYVIVLKGLKELYDILILSICILSIYIIKEYLNIDIYHVPVTSSILGILFIFTFLFFQIVVSKGAWMGGGDLRIAILMGLILGYSYSFAGVMIAYIFGSIIGILIILIQKIKKKENISTIIPFGPFLGIGLFFSLLFQKEINSFLFYYL